MTNEEARISALIRTAFENATLGDGVGLWQAQGIDDYEGDETIAEYRLRDEKQDWSRITASALNRCHSSLSFFDAEGMRFHLPAFLIAELEGTFEYDGVLFTLTYFVDGMERRFDLLSPEQRSAVLEYLFMCLADPDYEFERPMIENSLHAYWLDAGD